MPNESSSMLIEQGKTGF